MVSLEKDIGTECLRGPNGIDNETEIEDGSLLRHRTVGAQDEKISMSGTHVRNGSKIDLIPNDRKEIQT